ncbi:MAG: PIN domain-containing protein [Candidatus Heimdallarchaeota archaeon]
MDEVLLDTTYLLPVFGVNVGLKNFEKLFPTLLNTSHILYTPISIVEAKWVVHQLARKTVAQKEKKNILETYRRGLRSLFGDGRLTQTVLTKPEIEEIADQLLVEANIPNYFDRTIYATAVYYNVVLLTEDQELLNITKKKQLPKPKGAITWSDAARSLRLEEEGSVENEGIA